MSKEKNEGLNKVVWGESGKRWKRTFSFHWPPNKEPFPSPSFDHQTLDLPSPSFSFFLKGRLGSLELSLSLDIINSILRIHVPTSFSRRKRMINLGSWEKEGE
jgi:hypothetical protein